MDPFGLRAPEVAMLMAYAAGTRVALGSRGLGDGSDREAEGLGQGG